MLYKLFHIAICCFVFANMYAQDSARFIFNGHSNGVNSIDISPDGKRMISGSKDETIRVWDLEKNELVKTISMEGSSVKRVSYSHNGNKFVAVLYTRFIEMDAKTFKGKFSKKNTHSAFVENCVYSYDDKFILTSSWRDKTLVAWKSGSLKEAVETKEVTWVDNAIFNRSGNLIFSGGHDDVAKMWDFATGDVIRTYAGHNDWVYDLCLSADEKILYTASFDKTVKIWETNTGKNVATLKGHTEGLVCMDISKDGNYIATGGTDKEIIIWSTADRKEVKRIKAHDAAIMDLKFSADGKSIYSCSLDKTIKVWDVSTLN